MRSFRYISSTLLLSSAAVYAADPTWTLGNLDVYHKTKPAPSAPTGADLLILPDQISGIPADGVDVYLGPELQSQVNNVLTSKCNNGLSDDCKSSLISVLDQKNTGTLAVRAIPLAAAVWVVFAAIAIELGIEFNQKKASAPSALHLPSSDLAQLQAIKTTTMVALPSSAAAPITVTSQKPKTTSAVTPASVTTLAADDGKHHKGDVVIKLPAQQANLLKQAIAQVGGYDKCHNTTDGKRAVSGGTINRGAMDSILSILIYNTSPTGVFQGVGMQAIQAALPAFKDASDKAAMATWQAFAFTLRQYEDVALMALHNIVEAVYLAVYKVCTANQQDLSEIVIESWQYEDKKNDGNPCSTNKADQPVCDDTRCKGNLDKKCTIGDKIGCTCLPLAMPYRHPGNIDGLKEVETWNNALANTNSIGYVKCDMSKKIRTDPEAFKKMIDKACENNVLDTSYDMTLPIDKLVPVGDIPLTFSLNATINNGRCEPPCKDIYKAFLDNKSCSSDGFMASEGSNQLICGTAWYKIKDQIVNPSIDGVSSIDQYVDSGRLQCGTRTDAGNRQYWSDLPHMRDAANAFCDARVKDKLKLVPGKDDQKSWALVFDTFVQDAVRVEMTWRDNSNCPVADFGSSGAKEWCTNSFKTIIDGCDKVALNNAALWKQGGTFLHNCIFYSIKKFIP